MKLPYGSKPHLVASTDGTRYVINQVLYEKGLVVSTDGRRLVVFQVETEENDRRESGLIPPAAIIASQKTIEHDPDFHDFEEGPLPDPDEIQLPIRILAEDEGIEVEDDDSLIRFKDPISAKYPRWAAVIPDPAGYMQIALNAKFLAGLAEAMGTEEVVLHLRPDFDTTEDHSIVVSSPDMVDRFGVLQPCRRNNRYNGPIRDISTNEALAESLRRKAAAATATED